MYCANGKLAARPASRPLVPEAAPTRRGIVSRFFHDLLGFEFVSRIYLYSMIIGIVSGLGAVFFTYGLELSKFLLTEKLAGFRLYRLHGEVHFDFSFFDAPTYDEHLWLLLLLPAIGGLLSGYLTYRFAPETEGAGTDAMIDAFHNKRGQIRPVVAPIKALTTIITLASGGAAGQQGPLVQIGASLGSWISDKLKLSTSQRRILLLAGTAGGLGAIFRAPLGAAIASVEVLYREDFESDALIPCVISSFVAYSLYMAVFGFSHLFILPDLLFIDVRELFFYLILGVLCATVGIFYVKILRLTRALFNRLPVPRYWIVCGGGLLLGLLAFVDPRVLGAGFDVLQQGLHGELSLRAFLALALLKILASSCTVSSGGSGGVFGPSLFIGGMLGGAVGLIGQQYFPDIVQQPAAYIVVGMASFFGAVANTPLAALILVIEISGSYHLLPPLMVVSALALICARNYSIFENQVQNKFHSPSHMKDLTVNVLQNLRVGEVLPLLQNTSEAIVSNTLSYFSLSALSKKLGHLHFVVVDSEGHLRGMIGLDDIDLPEDNILRNLVLIEDMVVNNVSPIEAEDNLHEALQKLLDSDYDKLPVMRNVDEGASEFLGYIMYSDLMRVYHEEITRFERQE